MAEQAHAHAPDDLKRVDLSAPFEAEYWSNRLDASIDTLRRAVAAAGDEVSAVQAWLQEQDGGT